MSYTISPSAFAHRFPRRPILFIGRKNLGLSIKNWAVISIRQRIRSTLISVSNYLKARQSSPISAKAVVREFREYAIPTVEISLSDESSLDEIITLFVDINQQGVSVNRFDIVKAMAKNDPLLSYVFNLIAIEQRRQEDIFYRPKRVAFTAVLKRLKIVRSLQDVNSQVDRMWERLLEIVLFCKTGQHQKPVNILKNFISRPSGREPSLPSKLTIAEEKKLRSVFRFLRKAYRTSDLDNTPLAVDQTPLLHHDHEPYQGRYAARL